MPKYAYFLETSCKIAAASGTQAATEPPLASGLGISAENLRQQTKLIIKICIKHKLILQNILVKTYSG